MRFTLSVLLLVTVAGCELNSEAEEQEAPPDPMVNSVGMRFVPVSAGSFTMGEGDTAHKVTLTQAFQLGAYEVTQEQFEQVMGTNPSHFKEAGHPVEKVSWDQAVSFCRKLSALPEEQAAGFEYRLPTEAEWEYACRAGSTTIYSYGDDESELGDYAWFVMNSGSRTNPVGEKKENEWKLYDMHGNVWEWCQDRYAADPGGEATDPAGPATGSHRVLRGGGWYHYSVFCRSADRGSHEPDYRHSNLGFRVLRRSGT